MPLAASAINTLIERCSYNPWVMVFVDNVILLNRNPLPAQQALKLAHSTHGRISTEPDDASNVTTQTSVGDQTTDRGGCRHLHTAPAFA
ncbi:hypothetical protein M728_003639 (plasmid) [Ensifer sp. WSM1721]